MVPQLQIKDGRRVDTEKENRIFSFPKPGKDEKSPASGVGPCMYADFFVSFTSETKFQWSVGSGV